MLDLAKARKFVDQCWGDEVVPILVQYIKIPNKSPAFDPDWAAHGFMDDAVTLFERWARAKLSSLSGSSLEVVRMPDCTPIIVIDTPGTGTDRRCSTAHLDKQPEMTGWADGYGPGTPRLDSEKLYGRGTDDAYAICPDSLQHAWPERIPVYPARPDFTRDRTSARRSRCELRLARRRLARQIH